MPGPARMWGLSSGVDSRLERSYRMLSALGDTGTGMRGSQERLPGDGGGLQIAPVGVS